MSKSYIRPDDGATMVEVEPPQHFNAKVLQRPGRHPGGPGDREAKRKTACR